MILVFAGDLDVDNAADDVDDDVRGGSGSSMRASVASDHQHDGGGSSVRCRAGR